MTPKERFYAALHLETPDKIPTMHIQLGAGNYLQDRTGLTIKEAYSNPGKFARLCLATREFGFDNIMAGWGDLLNEAQAFGVQLSFPNERDYPRGTPVPPEDIDKLEYVDPAKDQVWSASLEAAKIIASEAGKDVAVVGQVSDPFTLAASVRGFDGLLMDEIMEPDRLHRLMKVLTDSLVEYGRLLKEQSGVEIVFIEDGSADSEQNEFQLAKTFDIDYAQNMAEKFHAMGLMTILSNCAKGAYLDAQFVAVRPTAIHTSYEWEGYRLIAGLVQGKCCLAAGLLPHFIARSDPLEVRQKVSELISSGDSSGLIVTSAGEIPFDAPLENVKALAGSTDMSLIR